MYRKALKLKTPNGGNNPSSTKPGRGILKKMESPHSSKDPVLSKPSVSGGVKSVKFKKSKSVQQARLRTKLNSWLESKGKTPSRYFNLMYFDEQVSAKKKRDTSLPGKLSENLINKQVQSLRKEEQNARKELFKGGNKPSRRSFLSDRSDNNAQTRRSFPSNKTDSREPTRRSLPSNRTDASKSIRRSLPVQRCNVTSKEQTPVLKKENTPRRSSDHQRSYGQGAETKPLSDNSNTPLTAPHPSSEKQQDKVPSHDSVNDSSVTPLKDLSHEQPITDHDIRQNLLHMLQECLTLLRAGCPSEHILSWLENMEQHIPQTQTCALFYACKAELFASDAVKVLEIFCQGVRNKAEPSQVMSDAMKQLLTPHLSCSKDTQSSHCSQPDVSIQREVYLGMDIETNIVVSADCHRDRDPKLHQGFTSLESRQAVPAKYEGSSSKTPVKKNCYINHADSSFGVNVNSGCRRRSTKHTPVKDSKLILESTPLMGSAIKYTVTSATPIPGQSPESVPMMVVTPVRRSTRLSNRHPTPQAQREIDSVLDLTLKEAEATMFSSNPAIENS